MRPIPRLGAVDDVFSRERRRLVGLAYRMTGVLADAEDVVQEVWLRWAKAQQSGTTIERPKAWLTTVTTHLALDRLKAQMRRREDYIGPWLPEPVVHGPGPEEATELAESLTFGFFAVLDLLGPIERAVFLLVDVFGVPYPDVAAAVGKTEVACRQIASRARRRIRDGTCRPPTGANRDAADRLVASVLAGDVNAALELLSPDVVLIADGGPDRRAARQPVVGATRVARYLINLAQRYTDNVAAKPVIINGDPGLVIVVDGATDLVVAFEIEAERVAAIWLVRNPDKLERLDSPPALT